MFSGSGDVGMMNNMVICKYQHLNKMIKIKIYEDLENTRQNWIGYFGFEGNLLKRL